MLGWMKHKLESRLPGEISITSDMQMTTLMAENKEELQKQKILRRGGKNTQKNCTKKIFTTQIITMM